MSIEIKLTAEQHAQIESQTMTLDQFLASVGGSESGIIEYKGAEAKAAVEQDGYALRYVHEQTPEICKAAVEQDGGALQYVHEQTPEICKAAVEQNGYALQFVHEQTPEICKAAVEQDVDALQFVNKAIFGAAPVIFIAGAKYAIEKVL